MSFLSGQSDLVSRSCCPYSMCIQSVLSLSSGQGETVVSILTDLHGFWMYENREMLLAENNAE